MFDSEMWNGASRREQLDRIWKYICEMPELERDTENVVGDVSMINERLKLIETILRQRREEHVRDEMRNHEKVISEHQFSDEFSEDIPCACVRPLPPFLFNPHMINANDACGQRG